MELIGKGSFSKVYKSGRNVYIKSKDHVKECMALGWFPNSHLFPKVSFSDKDGYDYKMRYYKKYNSLKNHLKPKEYEKYLLLRKFNGVTGYNELYQVFSKIKVRSLKEAMISSIDALSNYGADICFEISPRNVTISEAGNLVLLDCFFKVSQLKMVRGY